MISHNKDVLKTTCIYQGVTNWVTPSRKDISFQLVLVEQSHAVWLFWNNKSAFFLSHKKWYLLSYMANKKIESLFCQVRILFWTKMSQSFMKPWKNYLVIIFRQNCLFFAVFLMRIPFSKFFNYCISNFVWANNNLHCSLIGFIQGRWSWGRGEGGKGWHRDTGPLF